ncbi:MAG: glycosyltransferase family 2 protein [Anaerolineae bacterium]|nr:glycosyltransferase family 2 protein [Anaerolineae bacterium]
MSVQRAPTGSVTLIMPIRNEARFIERSLGAVLAQDYPPEQLEILVVDGASTDDTPLIVRRVIADRPNARLLHNPARIVPAAMNAGLAAAQGEIVVRVDGHTVVAPDYVRRCVAALQQTGADCVGGPMRAEGETAFGQAVALATSHPFGVGGARFHYATQPQEVDTVYMGAWPRAVFDRVGLFDEEMACNEDDEFNYRLRAAGGHIWLDPAIHSTYTTRATLHSLCRQYARYGLYKVRVFQKVPGSAQTRHWAPPLFALAVLGGLPIALVIPLLRLPYLAGLALYALADVFFSARIAARVGWRHFPLLLLVFPSLHLSYGAGFWGGTFRFGLPGKKAREK